MIGGWIAWSNAIDDALFGCHRTIEQLAQDYADASGVTVEELEAVRKWINWEEIEKHLQERDVE
jgi:hypothetical protein